MSARRRSRLFVARELDSALRARWFVVYSGIFLLGGLILSSLGSGDTAIAGYRGYAKAMAGLVHLALLFVPLMAIFPATAAIAEDRESGTLEYLLAQPVTFGDVYAGKWVGVTLAVVLSLTIGFAPAAAVAMLRGVPPGLVLTAYTFVLVLALAFVSVGVLLSVVAGSRSKATTLGIVAWLVFVALGSLGVMAVFLRWGLPRQVLYAWTFLNPVEAFRVGVVTVLDPDLSLLGPLGTALVERIGVAGAVTSALASLTLWTLLPLVVGWRRFPRSRIVV
ncbi:MAG: ABC transporter permease [Gemmatimonadota bacterium]